MTTRGFARHERSLFWLVVAFLVIAAAGRSGRGPAASLLGPARHQRQSLGSSSTSVTTEASTSVTTVPPSPATTVPSTSQTVPSTPVTTPNASTTSTSIVANGDTQAFSAGNCVDFDQREPSPTVVKVPCSSPHVYEVTGRYEMPIALGAPVPSDGELDKVLAPCLPITQRWLGRPLSPSSRFAEIDWVPVGTQWDRGVRTADCAADSGRFRTPVLADSVQRFWGFSYTPWEASRGPRVS